MARPEEAHVQPVTLVTGTSTGIASPPRLHFAATATKWSHHAQPGQGRAARGGGRDEKLPVVVAGARRHAPGVDRSRDGGDGSRQQGPIDVLVNNAGIGGATRSS